MSDVYNYPEDHGLEIVAEIDYSTGSYEYDLRVVWRHRETGKLYTAQDSGCSCPSPFEAYTSVESLEPFRLSVIEEEVRDRQVHGHGDGHSEFVEKIRKLEGR